MERHTLSIFVFMPGNRSHKSKFESGKSAQFPILQPRQVKREADIDDDGGAERAGVGRAETGGGRNPDSLPALSLTAKTL